MPAGLQAFDANGNVIADLTDRIPKVFMSGSAGIIRNVGEYRDVPCPGMANDGTWYVQVHGQLGVIINNGSFRIYRYDYWADTGTTLEAFYTVIKQ